jgi:hypothetical protein
MAALLGGAGAGSSGGGATRDVRTIVRVVMALTWLSVSGANGAPADGWRSAWTMSWMPLRIKSLMDASGICTFVGNHARVSQMRVARMSHIHTV